MQIIDFSHIERIHLVGIKGIAMAAFAMWAKESGMQVTGSDIDEHFPSDALLLKKGITIFSGFDPSHISEFQKPDLVVYTGAHKGMGNVEVQRAMDLNIPVLAHGKALGLAMSSKRQISVAGSHGKTTTSAMIATILMMAKMDPSYAIGCGEIRGLGDPGHSGTGDMFVAEADEYITDPEHDRTPRFMWQNPEFFVVTNIDFDHPDAYENLAQVQSAFLALQKQLVGKKITILNADDVESSVLQESETDSSVITYGTSNSALYKVESIIYDNGKTRFSLLYADSCIGQIELHIPGMHNVLNATAAAVTCLLLGVSWKDISDGLAAFGGAKRRFELLADLHGIRYYDDYAHHPKEIKATLQAARSWFSKSRIVAVFQPHTYSRTKTFLNEFSQAFVEADLVILTDIYASARETDTYGVTGMMLFEEVKKYHPNVAFAHGKEEVIHVLRRVQQAGDVIVCMGAGDIYTWEPDIIRSFTI